MEKQIVCITLNNLRLLSDLRLVVRSVHLYRQTTNLYKYRLNLQVIIFDIGAHFRPGKHLWLNLAILEHIRNLCFIRNMQCGGSPYLLQHNTILPHQQHIMWKLHFNGALKQYLSQTTKAAITSDAQMYELMSTQRKSRGIWLQVSEQLNVTQQQVHDYFHNTWIKQFFDSFDEHKAELKSIVQSLLGQVHDRSLISQRAIDLFVNLHLKENFHVKSLQQFVHHELQKYKDGFKGKPAVHVEKKKVEVREAEKSLQNPSLTQSSSQEPSEAKSSDISKYILFG
ncbi:Conserved_hypothetical protein [Hexamita inflata]|uniref:Uncharacterized protein n=1 Tax=Hexamita inflata TaxID=28002 RepID=A0AA86N5F5_9EUKA|nr:Conserved hypothetical protein [Hexamita inflata]